jgi:hypothetical protein
MIIEYSDNPKKSLYFLGYQLLKLARETNNNLFIDIEEAYDQFKKINNIPFSRFMLVLDWLYLCNMVSAEQNGRIKFYVS